MDLCEKCEGKLGNFGAFLEKSNLFLNPLFIGVWIRYGGVHRSPVSGCHVDIRGDVPLVQRSCITLLFVS